MKSQRSRCILVVVLVLLILPCLFMYLSRTSSTTKFVGLLVGFGVGSIIATLVGRWIDRGR